MVNLFKRSLLALFFLFIIVATFLYLYLRSSLPELSGSIYSRSGVSAEVSLQRDALGTAIISAESRQDAAYGLGVAHGQDRFFQLDIERRYAAGELSALLGEKALEHDKSLRIHQMRLRAQEVVAQLDNQSRELIDAYVAGVNAGLATVGGKPFEYSLLGQEPQPWVPEDSVLVSAFMFERMTGNTVQQEFSRGLLLRLGGEALLDFLQPGGTQWDSALDGSKIAAAPIPGVDQWALGKVQVAGLSEHQGLPPMIGSNSWAISGQMSKHKGAILSNDPHLGFSQPQVWYRTRLSYPLANGERVTLSGVSFPGLPSLAIGSNGSVAWSMTSSGGDWADLIALEVDGDLTHYKTAEGMVPFKVYKEVIEVAGAESVELEVKRTQWGPLYQLNGESYAYRWLMHKPEAIDASKFINLDEAKSVADALDVAKHTGISPFNMVAADASGDIGWTLIGILPKRGSVKAERPIPWQQAGVSWQGWLSKEDYPQILDESKPYLWTANNRLVGGVEANKIGFGQYELGTRGWLIEQDLIAAHEIGAPMDELAVAESLYNNKAVMLEGWKQYLVELLTRNNDNRYQQVLDVLNSWSGHASVDDSAYTLVRAFHKAFQRGINEALIRRLKDDNILQKDYPEADLWLFSRQSEAAFVQLRDLEPVHWLPENIESWDSWSLSHLDGVIEDLMQRYGSLDNARWGLENRLKMHHPITPALPRILADWINMPADELAGDSHMPLAQHPSQGQSMRFVVSPGREDEAILTLPGGQSGHPLSPFYRSGREDWVKHRHTSLLAGEVIETLKIMP